MTNLPLYFYPTTISFIDDNERFLKNNILGLNPKYQYRQYIEPEVALNELKHKNTAILKTDNFIHPLGQIEELDNTTNAVALSLNLKPILSLASNLNRFARTSLIVVDYAMPSMNGLELCQHLKSSPIKKIMITGQADHRLAVDAFNRGIIDYFILKDEADFYTKLNKAIDKLNWEFFCDQSKPIFNNLNQHDHFCLKYQSVRNFIKNQLINHNIREAYLIDSSGSYLLINQHGEKSYLIIKSKAEMLDIAQTASLQSCNQSIINKLSALTHMVAFLDDSHYEMPADLWEQIIRPCTPIDHEKLFFAADFP